MANSIKYKEDNFRIGDMIVVNYKIKEGEKERIQPFKGILMGVKGSSELNRMITVRKVSTKTGIGIERIFPLATTNIASIKLDKTSSYHKAKLYFIRNLSGSQLRNKLYKVK